MCEHNKKVKIFCVTEDCSHGVPFACMDCIRKHHKAGAKEALLQEDELLNLLKLYQVPTHIKEQRKGPIYRLYQMLTSCKNQICDQLDRYFGSILNKLKYPFLYHENILDVFRIVRDKNYHKLAHSELLSFYKTSKRTTSQCFIAKEVHFYQQYVKETHESIKQLNDKLKALEQILNFSITRQTYALQHDIMSELTTIIHQNSVKQSLISTPLKLNAAKKQQIKPAKPNNSLNNSFLAQPSKVRPKLDQLFLTPKKSEESLDLSMEKSVSILSNDSKSASRLQDIGATLHKSESKTSILKPNESSLFSANKTRTNEKVKQEREKQQKRATEVIKDETTPQLQQYHYNTSQEDSIFIKISDISPPPTMQSSLNDKINNCETNSTIHQSTISDKKDPVRAKEENVAKRLADLIKEKTQKQAEVNSKTPTKNSSEIKELPVSTLKNRLELRQSHFLSVVNKRKGSNQESSFSDSLGKDVFQFSREERPKIISRSIKKQIPLPEAASVKTEPAHAKPLQSTNEKEIQMAAIFIAGINQPSIENKVCFLEKYLAKYDSNLTAVEYLSFLYLQQGKPKECHSLCSAYLERLGDCRDEKATATLATNCSAALNQLGRYSETIKCIEERLIRNGENDLMHKIIADAFFSIGVMDKAVYHYERATKLNAQLDEAYYNLAVILYQQDSFFNAKMNIDKALALKNHPQYIQLRSHIEERIQLSQDKQ